MNEEEAIKNLKKQLEGIKKANECGLATRGEFNKDINAIETVLNLLEKKDKVINEMSNFINLMGNELVAEIGDNNLEFKIQIAEIKKLKDKGGKTNDKARNKNKRRLHTRF